MQSCQLWTEILCVMLRSVLFFAISLPCARTIVVSWMHTTWCQMHADSCKGQKHSLQEVDSSQSSCPWREHNQRQQDPFDLVKIFQFDPLPVFVDWNMDGYTDVLEAGWSRERQLISQALHLFFHAILTYQWRDHSAFFFLNTYMVPSWGWVHHAR